MELVNPRQLAITPTTLAQPLSATDDVLHVANPYRVPQAGGTVQIDNERIHYQSAVASRQCCGDPRDYMSGLVRGDGGTGAQSHPAGATVTALDDAMHWDWDDAYWVYGQGANEVRVRYSDGAVLAPGSLPQISAVQVQPTANGATLTWQTDRPATRYVEYDTYGASEQYNSRRPAAYWPTYRQRSAATAKGTQHQVTLTGLKAGAPYHYSLVVRGPAQARTVDATFTMGGTD